MARHNRQPSLGFKPVFPMRMRSTVDVKAMRHHPRPMWVAGRLVAVAGIVVALMLGVASPAAAGDDDLTEPVPAEAADAIPLPSVEPLPPPPIEPTAEPTTPPETDEPDETVEVLDIGASVEPLPESPSEPIGVVDPTPTPSPVPVVMPTEPPPATSTTPMPQTSTPATASSETTPIPIAISIPIPIPIPSVPPSTKSLPDSSQPVGLEPETVELSGVVTAEVTTGSRPIEPPERQALPSELVATPLVQSASVSAKVGTTPTVARQSPSGVRTAVSLTVAARRPDPSLMRDSFIVEPSVTVASAAGIAGGILRLVPDIGLSGAGVALSAPKATAVSVAVEFGRAGSGWAGTLVFNVWLKRQLRERRISQRKLGAMSGVDHSTISRLLANGGRAPTLETATKLTHALRMNWTDEEVALYFDLLNDRTQVPTQRVEWALRGDDELDERDVRALMHAYLEVRARKRYAVDREIPTIPTHQSTREQASQPVTRARRGAPQARHAPAGQES